MIHGTARLIETKWQLGEISAWWTHEHRALDYIHEQFNCPEDTHRWRELGYTQQRFTGDMYDMRFSEPQWVSGFRDAFPLQHFSWSVYRMRPGDVLPNHSDIYRRFCDIYQINDPQTIRRYVVFLEDWQSGHYFEIDGIPVVKWQAGSWACWHGDTPHLAANIGSTDRYTLQITGLPLAA